MWCVGSIRFSFLLFSIPDLEHFENISILSVAPSVLFISLFFILHFGLCLHVRNVVCVLCVCDLEWIWFSWREQENKRMNMNRIINQNVRDVNWRERNIKDLWHEPHTCVRCAAKTKKNEEVFLHGNSMTRHERVFFNVCKHNASIAYTYLRIRVQYKMLYALVNGVFALRFAMHIRLAGELATGHI